PERGGVILDAPQQAMKFWRPGFFHALRLVPLLRDTVALLSVVVMTAIWLPLCSASAAPGDVDLSFDPGSGVVPPGVSGPIHTMVVQPDGKILIVGEFRTVKGSVKSG